MKLTVAIRILAVSLIVLAHACARGADDAEKTATGERARPNVVTVSAYDYAFEAPQEIRAGLTMFQLLERGDAIHHLTVIRLDSGKTAADYVNALKPDAPLPAWSTAVGGPNPVDPGETANAMVVLEPGNYALVCFVDQPEHRPHFTRGMFKDLRVVARPDTTPARMPPSLPPAAVTMRLVDYDFTTTGELRPGLTTFRVENAGTQTHEVFLAKLQPGTTAQQALAWIQNPQGPPRFSALGGISLLAPGYANNFTANLTAGRYALICFVPDARDGRPHFLHGMIKEIEIS